MGHRSSIDIDLFSDAPYGSIDFDKIDRYLEETFPFKDHFANALTAFGKSYLIGMVKDNSVKLDVYYTDPFIRPVLVEDTIRMASSEEIVAMKLDVIQRGGRKKDYWDIHELLPSFSIQKMLDLHYERYEYNHNKDLILKNLTSFSNADYDFDPICLRGKYWEFIKEDIEEAVVRYISLS